MKIEDAALVTDPRTETIAAVLGETPEHVVEEAETFAEIFGDTVTEELDEGVRQLTGE